MPNHFGHHQLQNRYQFFGTLQLTTPLRLSSGRASETSDAPLIRTRDGRPYIPGSSLRGALRSAVERILAAVGDSAGVTSCVLFSVDDCNTRARTFQLQQSESPEADQNSMDKKLADFAAGNGTEKGLCDVCTLFGSTIYASRLVIEDAYPQGKKEMLTPYEIVRDGVGIDRDTGTASEGAKFNYEVLEKGPSFLFRMQIENLTEQDRKILNLIRSLLKDGLHVGGKRAVGLGEIKLSGDFTVHGVTSPQALWDAIQNNAPLLRPLRWEEVQSC